MPTSGNDAAPLAAAAAIAASTPSAAGTVSAFGPEAVAVADTATVTPAAKTADQPTASDAVATPVKQPATPAGQTAATDAALTEAVVVAPMVPKAEQIKIPAALQTKAAASGAQEPDPGADPSTTAAPLQNNVAQQPVAGTKQDAWNGAVDKVKTDTASNSPSVSTPAPSTHDHPLLTATPHAPADTANTGVQTTATIPQQLTPAAAAVDSLSVTVATGAPVPLNGLALEIAASVRSGKSRFEIRLDPADLGRIDVRIDVDRNGQVTSHLRVERPETLSMLRQDAPQLQRALDDAGFKTGDGGLQFSLRDQSSSGQNNGNETSRNAQRLVISDEDTIPAAVAGRTYGRMLGSSSGVDIRV
jgi:flagellar hook-length control protein FliK